MRILSLKCFSSNTNFLSMFIWNFSRLTNPPSYGPRLKNSLLLLFSCWIASASLWPHGLEPARLLCPWDFPGKTSQERNQQWVAVSSSRWSSPPRDWTHGSYIGRRILTAEPPWEAPQTLHLMKTAIAFHFSSLFQTRCWSWEIFEIWSVRPMCLDQGY